jgi:guanylate kinase
LGLPDEIRDNLIVIEEARLLGAHTEEAKTLSGDFYMVLLLVDLCQRAVEVMDEVRAGTKTLDYAKYEVYGKLKEKAIRLLDIEITAYMNAFNQGKKSMRLNPPPTFKKGEFEAFIPPEYLQATGIVTEALQQYAPYQEGKPFITGRNKVNMRIPTNGTVATVMIGSLAKGGLQIIVPAKGHPMPEDAPTAALEAYQTVVNRLNEYGLSIPTEEQEVGSLTVSNPRKNNQLIIIAGPSGAGKSTTLRNLDKMLPNSKLIRSYVTRPKRKSDRAGEKNFVTEKQFKEMVANGEFLEHAKQKSGDYYGKRLEDFKADADYLITEASLSGVNRLKKAFPNAFTIYLEPSESAEMIRKRLLRRGDMSPQMARGRSSKIPSHIKSSKMMPFNKRIITRQGKFDSIALEIMDSIPRSNPGIPFRVPKEVKPEIERRLTEEMRQPGYKPQSIADAIEEGIYDDQPSNFSYAQGEYDEFLEEIEKGDMDEAYAEYSDVEGHVAYWNYTNLGIETPIYSTIHLDKTRKRIKVFANIFADFGLKMDSKYLKGGSNFQKTTKVRLALETAAQDQGVSFNATDNEIRDSIAKAVPDVVMENPIGPFRKKGFEKYLPRRGKKTVTRQDYRGRDYEQDAYETGKYEIEDVRKQLALMDAIDKLPPSEQERMRTPLVRKFMKIGGKEILLDQSDEPTPAEQDYLELEKRLSRGFDMRESEDQGYYDRLTDKKLVGRARPHWMKKEVPSRIPFIKTRVEHERVPIRKFADETIGFTTEAESHHLLRSMERMSNMFSGKKADDRDRYEKVIHSKIQAYSNKINRGETPSYLLLGEIPDEVEENLSSTILELDAKLVDIKENHESEMMKRKYEDDSFGEWEEYMAQHTYLRGYKYRQSVKGEMPTMVETMIYDLYDMAFMAQLQTTTDHEFAHRADISSYLLGTDYSQYDEEGNIITPYDIEEYGGDERTTIVSESTPQILQAQYAYMGIELYPTNPGYYMGVIWVNETYDYAKFRRVLGKNLEEAEARESFKEMSHGEFRQYYPTVETVFFAIVEAPDSYSAKKIVKEHFRGTKVGKQGVIYFNPKRKVTSVRIEESPNKAKKMVAYFFDEEGKKVKTTHFGARGMSDYTQHKDPKRKDNYLSRHGGMGEDWKDPTTAGALSTMDSMGQAKSP